MAPVKSSARSRKPPKTRNATTVISEKPKKYESAVKKVYKTKQRKTQIGALISENSRAHNLQDALAFYEEYSGKITRQRFNEYIHSKNEQSDKYSSPQTFSSQEEQEEFTFQREHSPRKSSRRASSLISKPNNDSSSSRMPSRHKEQEEFISQKMHSPRKSQRKTSSHVYKQKSLSFSPCKASNQKEQEEFTSQKILSPRKSPRRASSLVSKQKNDSFSPRRTLRQKKNEEFTSHKMHSPRKSSRRASSLVGKWPTKSSSPRKSYFTGKMEKAAVHSPMNSSRSASVAKNSNESFRSQRILTRHNIEADVSPDKLSLTGRTFQEVTPRELVGSPLPESKMEPILNQQTSFIKSHKLTRVKKSIEAFLGNRSLLSPNSFPREPFWWMSVDKTVDLSGPGAVLAGITNSETRVPQVKNLPAEVNMYSNGKTSTVISSKGKNYSRELFTSSDNSLQNLNAMHTDTSKTSSADDSIINKAPKNRLVFKKPRPKRMKPHDLFEAVFQQQRSSYTKENSSGTCVAQELHTTHHEHKRKNSISDSGENDTVTPPKKRHAFRKRQMEKTGNDDWFDAAFENSDISSANTKLINTSHSKKKNITGSENYVFSDTSDKEDGDENVALPRHPQIRNGFFDDAFKTSSNVGDNLSSALRESGKRSTRSFERVPSVNDTDNVGEDTTTPPKKIHNFKKYRLNKIRNEKHFDIAFNSSINSGAEMDVSRTVREKEPVSTCTSTDSNDSDNVTLTKRYTFKKAAHKKITKSDLLHADFEKLSRSAFQDLSGEVKVTAVLPHKPTHALHTDDLSSGDFNAVTPHKILRVTKKHQEIISGDYFDAAFDNSSISDTNKKLSYLVELDKEFDSRGSKPDTPSHNTTDGKDSDVTPPAHSILSKSRHKVKELDLFHADFERFGGNSIENLSGEMKVAGVSPKEHELVLVSDLLQTSKDFTTITPPKSLHAFKKSQRAKISDAHFDAAFEKPDISDANKKMSNSLPYGSKHSILSHNTSDSQDSDDRTLAVRHGLRKSLRKNTSMGNLLDAAFENSGNNVHKKPGSEIGNDKAAVSHVNSQRLSSKDDTSLGVFHAVTPHYRKHASKSHQELNISDAHFEDPLDKSDISETNKKMSNASKHGSKHSILSHNTSDSQDSDDRTLAVRHGLRKSLRKNTSLGNLLDAAFENSGNNVHKKPGSEIGNDKAAVSHVNSQRLSSKDDTSLGVFHAVTPHYRKHASKSHQELNISDAHFEDPLDKSDISETNKKMSNASKHGSKHSILSSSTTDSKDIDVRTMAARHALRKSVREKTSVGNLLDAAFESSGSNVHEKPDSENRNDKAAVSIVKTKSLLNEDDDMSSGEFQAGTVFHNSNTSDTNKKLSDLVEHDNESHRKGSKPDTSSHNVTGGRDSDVTPPARGILSKSRHEVKERDLFHPYFERFGGNSIENLSGEIKVAGVSPKGHELVLDNDLLQTSKDFATITPRKRLHAFKKRQRAKISDAHFDAVFEKPDISDANKKMSNSLPYGSKHSILSHNTSDSQDSDDRTLAVRHGLRKSLRKNTSLGNLLDAAFENSGNNVHKKPGSEIGNDKAAVSHVNSQRLSSKDDTSLGVFHAVTPHYRKHASKSHQELNISDAHFEDPLDKSDISETNKKMSNASKHGSKHSILSSSTTDSKDSDVRTMAARHTLRKSVREKTSVGNLLDAAFESSGSNVHEKPDSENRNDKAAVSIVKTKSLLNEDDDMSSGEFQAGTVFHNSNTSDTNKKLSDLVEHDNESHRKGSKPDTSSHNVTGGRDSDVTPPAHGILSKSRHEVKERDLFHPYFERFGGNSIENLSGEIKVAGVSPKGHELVLDNDLLQTSKDFATITPRKRLHAFKKRQRAKISDAHFDAVFEKPDTSDANKKISNSLQHGSKHSVLSHNTSDSQDSDDRTLAIRHALRKSLRKKTVDNLLDGAFELSSNQINEKPISEIGNIEQSPLEGSNHPLNKDDAMSSGVFDAVTLPQIMHASKKHQQDEVSDQFDKALSDLGSSSTNGRELCNPESDQLSSHAYVSVSPVLVLPGISLHESDFQKIMDQAEHQGSFQLSEELTVGNGFSGHKSLQTQSAVHLLEEHDVGGVSPAAESKSGRSVANINKVINNLEITGLESESEQILPEIRSKQILCSSKTNNGNSATGTGNSGNESSDGRGLNNIGQLSNNTAKLVKNVGANSLDTCRQSKISEFIAAYKKKKEKKQEELKLIKELSFSFDFPVQVPRHKITKKSVKEVDPDFLVDGKVYRPRRLKKPAPWFSKQLYNVLTLACELKFGGLKFKRKAEENAIELSNKIKQVIKLKQRYEPIVEDVKKQLFNLGVIETLDDFYHFIRDYLPEEFRYKVIPCLTAFGRTTGIPIPAGIDPWARLTFD